jgi:potassium channel
MWKHNKIRHTRTQDAMPTSSDAGQLQEITDSIKSSSIYSYKDGGSLASERKRVTVHVYSKRNKNIRVPFAKVMYIPGSLEELFAIACKYSSIHTHH